MLIILYSAVTIFIILIILVFIIKKTKYCMRINSSNILTSDGRITMSNNYEPQLNDITTLKNVLSIRKGLFAIYKSRHIQEPLNLGDVVSFGNNATLGMDTICPSDNKISVLYDNNTSIFTIINDSDKINYIKITYAPPSLSGLNSICRFNIYVNDTVLNITSPIYRTSTDKYISNVPIGIYIMKLLPLSTYKMDVRITELFGTDLHLGYEGYVIIEEL